MQLKIDDFLRRADKALEELDLNRQMFEDCYEYILPYRNTFVKDSNDKSFNKASKQYDSTPMIAANNFVNTMQSNFTPVFTRWAEFKAGAGVPEKQRDRINKDLSKLTDLVFTYLNASNFSTAVSEMYFDWGIGTGSLWLFEGDETQPLNFVATPMSQMALSEGRFGSVDFRGRKWKIKARLIKATWPNDEISLITELERMMKEKPDDEVELIEGCYYDYQELVWHYDVVHKASKHRILSRTYKEEICFTPRWMKVPGFSFGIGPFLLAMLDIKTLNKIKEYMLRSAALNIFGVYTVANSGAMNFSSATLTPGTFIPVERNAGANGPSIAPLPRNGDFQMQEFLVQDLKDSIRKVMLDNKMPAETPQPKTAFEIAQRIKEFQVDIGSAYGRAMYEFVQPLFKRIVAILSRKGLIQLPEGFEIDNFFVQVQVLSPIAQTQALEDVQRLMNNMNLTASVGGQELVMTSYEVENLPKWLADKTGPIALLRDPEEAKQMQAQMMQMAAQQQPQG